MIEREHAVSVLTEIDKSVHEILLKERPVWGRLFRGRRRKLYTSLCKAVSDLVRPSLDAMLLVKDEEIYDLKTQCKALRNDTKALRGYSDRMTSYGLHLDSYLEEYEERSGEVVKELKVLREALTEEQSHVS